MRFRHLLSSRKVRVLLALVVVAGATAALRSLDLIPRPLPGAGILVVDLRHALPDTTDPDANGLRSVSAVTVLRALDAARSDRRIAGVYLRVGGRTMSLAQAAEIAGAVRRMREAGKFAVAWSGGFTAANLSDRVLAAAADELWTEPGSRDENWHPGQKVAHPENTNEFRLAKSRLSAQLLNQASELIGGSAPEHGSAVPSVDVVTRAANLSPTQHHRGPEARAEQGALAWAGPEAGFVDLLTYREALETRQRNAPIVALVQAEGVLDLLEGPGSHELAGPLVERIRNAASDSRVRGIVVRISAVAASDEALRMVVQAADKARRSGKPVGISFGPLVPAGVASVQANIPMSAPTGALLVNLAPGGEATALASRVRYPWRVRDGERALSGLPAETAFLQQGAVMATVVAGEALSAAMADLPDDGVNDLPNAEAQGSAVQVAWQNDVGSLLDMKDRLTDGRRGDLLLAPYERRSSVWSRTRTRFEKLRIRITNLFMGRSRNSSE